MKRTKKRSFVSENAKRKKEKGLKILKLNRFGGAWCRMISRRGSGDRETSSKYRKSSRRKAASYYCKKERRAQVAVISATFVIIPSYNSRLRLPPLDENNHDPLDRFTFSFKEKRQNVQINQFLRESDPPRSKLRISGNFSLSV